jgi:hypothetical protein
LRYEHEDGIRERDAAMLVGFDPAATNSITQLAEAAYAKNPIAQVPASAFHVLGAAVYAGSPKTQAWKGQSMYEPRLGASYKLGSLVV